MNEDPDERVHLAPRFRRPSSAREQEIAKLYLKALKNSDVVICSVCPLHDVDYTELDMDVSYDDDFIGGLEALAIRMGGWVIEQEEVQDEGATAEGVSTGQAGGQEPHEQEEAGGTEVGT